MQGQFQRQQIENWVDDFCSSDAIRAFPSSVREYASSVLIKFIIVACDVREVEPGDLEEADVKAALLGPIAKLNLPAGVKSKVPALCGALLGHMETEGRLSGGKLLGAYVRALNDAFEDAASGKAKPIVRPGSRLKRNDPCPCGSGKKYKKCCMNG
ncbi:MAG: SEC-C domain-containing protein [Planctomycetes bacterium]|nr:SEC-C domain-containing protein [Planctomycetota bacterium]MBI3833781.1 SEC-C domain-containing protein [Planctomycetota bacterium]